MPRSSGMGPLIGVVTAIAAVNCVIYSWGDMKVSKMLPAYPDKPRTVEKSGVTYTAHLKSQLAKAEQRIQELTEQKIPEDRETKEEEKARWKEQKQHLLNRIAELEEKILLVINANGEHTSNDSDFIGQLAEGGES